MRLRESRYEIHPETTHQAGIMVVPAQCFHQKSGYPKPADRSGQLQPPVIHRRGASVGVVYIHLGDVDVAAYHFH